MLSDLLYRFRAVLGRNSLEAELEDELRAHLEHQIAKYVQSGLTGEEAARRARLDFGGLDQVKEECRDARGVNIIETTIQDIRYGLRQLRRSPGFTAVAVVTLGLGIGANTAIFDIGDAVLLKPLPYRDPDRLVMLWERSTARGIEQEKVSGPDLIDRRRENHVFDNIGYWPSWLGADEFNLVGVQGVEKVRGIYASSNLFSVLGVRPLLGRGFLLEEDRWQGNRVAVISHELWQRRFGADLGVLGRTLRVDSYGRRDYTIVGVMPPGFRFPGDCDLWLPVGWMGVRLDERRSAYWHSVIARLKEHVTLDRAQSDGVASYAVATHA